jgi:HK97 family phage portal protein
MILNRAIRNARAMMRAAEFGDSSIPPNSIAGGFHSGYGAQVGEAAALAIGTVLACIKALYDDTAVLPFKAYVGDRNGPHAPIAAQPRIVVEPFGPDVEPSAGFGQIVVSKAMRGNGYGYVVSTDPRTGLPDQLLVLHPDAVAVRHDKKRGKYFVVGGEEYGPTEIVHMPGLMLPGAISGVDVLTYQRTTHELAWKVNAYAEGFFGGGGSPAGVIAVKGKGDRTKAREVRETWEDSHAGVVNAHRPAVLFGDATWTPMTVSPNNAQFLETRRFLREELCGLYGVPLQRVQAIVENASQGGGKGVDAFDAQYVKHGLMPTHSGIEWAWSRMLPGGQGSWTAFDYDEFLRANAEVRAAVAQQHRVAGIRTIDEIRAKDYGMEPYPDGVGSNPFVPLNSNASPAGGADNAPAPGGQGGTQ